MDILNEAVSKAKDIFDIAYKKAENVASVGMQKIDVASMKSNLSKQYEAFGKAVIEFAENSEDTSDNIKNMISSIRTLEAEISNAEQKILKAKGKKFCENCGASNVSEAHFCYACGESFINTENSKEN